MTDEVILLVEDNPDDVDLAIRAFRRNQINTEIVVATDGEQALDYLFCRGKYENRHLSKKLKLVLLDLKIPKIDGHEVLRQIRVHMETKKLPVVVILTSSREEHDLVKAYQNGVNSYIRKPVDFDHFISAVNQLGLYWLLLNEVPRAMEEV